jgi:hypothetical protein
MSKFKVYISSTYVDLKVHRQQVIDFFNKRTIRENFDLLSMEGYVADNTAPAIECMDDVKNCSIYVLIMANRYGYIPVTNNPGNLSITEMEYNTAKQDPQKTILAFIADENDPGFLPDNDDDMGVRNLKKEKLQQFKTAVRQERVTNPEPFISPFQLALQVAESLMRKSFVTCKLDTARTYCCDRVPQFSRFLMSRNSSTFKTIIIYGDRKELGLNLINRVNIFALDLPEDSIQNQLLGFEDFLVSETYVQNRDSLLAYVYDKYFPGILPPVITMDVFLSAFKSLQEPLVIVISCDADMFEESQLTFTTLFIDELNKSAGSLDGLPIYLFINLEDNNSSDRLPQQLQQLQRLPGQDQYLLVLPRLQSLSTQLIKSWLISYVTPNPGNAEQLMDACFNNLPAPVSMYEANKKMQAFISLVNAADPTVCNLLN